MDLADYKDLTGLAVASSDEVRVQTQIVRTRRILETMLGFTLDTSLAETNLYTETGKTVSECPCPDVNTDTLLDPDAVVTAYRVYPYNRNDKYLRIDPCTAINAVKLVKDGITFRTYETSEYMANHGLDQLITSLEVCQDCCTCVSTCKNCVQVAVDADWVWTSDDDIPEDLLYVWCDMVTYYTDRKLNIKTESLGTHSYSKFDNKPPQLDEQNIAVIRKYAGPLGSVLVTPTV